MFAALFSGCLGGNTIIKVGGKNISEELYTAAVMLSDSMFQQNYGMSMATMLDQEIVDGKTGATMLKEQTDGFFKEFEALKRYAEEKGIALTEEEKKALVDNKQSQIDAAGGRKAFLESIEASGANEAFFDYIAESQAIYNKAVEELCKGDGEFVPTLDEVVNDLAGYVRVKHVLVLATEGDEDYAEKKAKAEGVLKRARAGEDFDALIKEFGEDPGMTSTPEGYVIDANGMDYSGTGPMVTEFTEASHAIAVNGVSDIVTTTHGFHIIKRYPLDKAYIEKNIDTYSSSAATNAFTDAIYERIDSIEFETTAAYDKLDLKKILKTNSNAATSEEHYEGDGHDHSTEGGAEGGIEEGQAITVEPVPAQ